MWGHAVQMVIEMSSKDAHTELAPTRSASALQDLEPHHEARATEMALEKQREALTHDLRRAMFSQYFQSVTASPFPSTEGIDPNASENSRLTSPTEELLAKRLYVVITSLLALSYLASSLRSSPVWAALGEQTAQIFRFSAVETRSGVPSVPSIAEFGVLSQGCMVRLVNASTSGASMTMRSSGGPITHNGWWLKTLDNISASSDPIKFTLEGSEDGVTWQPQGGSTWILGRDNTLTAGSGRLAPHLERGEVLQLRHDEGWAWTLFQVVPKLLSVGLVTCFALALSQRRRLGAMVFGFSLYGTFALLVGAAVGQVMTIPLVGTDRALKSLLMGLAAGWIPVAIDVLYLPAAPSLLVSGLMVLLARVVEAVQMDMPHFLRSSVPVFPIILVLSSAAVGAQELYVRRARRFTRGDRALYDACWAGVQGAEHARMQLQVLKSRTRRLQSRLPGAKQRRHLNRRVDAAAVPSEEDDAGQPIRAKLIAVAEDCREHSELDAEAPVQSLAQLFAQNAALAPILRDKMVEWARLGKGWLALPRATDGDTLDLVTWREAVRDERFCERGGMASKSRERARRKAMECYRSDVSRLLDITRNRLVFDGIGDLVECLNTIARDPDVRLVRVRNAMTDEHNAGDTAGYRDVKLNLIIQNMLTRRFGVDGHVCEVLLVLKEMVVIQTSASHQRYLQLRTTRDTKYWSSELLQQRWQLWCERSTSQRSQRVPPVASTDEMDGHSLSVSVDKVDPSTIGPQLQETEPPPCPPDNADSRDLGSHPSSADTADILLSQLDADGISVSEFRKQSRLPGGFLQERVSEVELASSTANTDSLPFTSRPISTSLTRLRWRFLTCTIGLYLVVTGAMAIGDFTDINQGGRFRRYRFTPLELRDGTTDIASPHISGFRLLRFNCPVAAAEVSPVNGTRDGGVHISIEGKSMFLTFHAEEPPMVNGWEFITSNDDPRHDPVRFTIHGSNSNVEGGEEAVWQRLERGNRRGSVTSHGVLRFNTPVERNHSVAKSFEIPIQSQLTNPAMDLIVGSLAVLTGVLAQFGRLNAASACAVSALWTFGILSFTPALMWFLEGATENGLYWLFTALPLLANAAIATFRESLLMPAFVSTGFTLFLWDIVAGFTMYQENPTRVFASMGVFGPLMFAFGGIAYLFRLRSIRQCKLLIRRDKAVYDGLWAALISDARHADELTRLDDSARRLLSADSAQSRQYDLTSPYKLLLHAHPRWQERDVQMSGEGRRPLDLSSDEDEGRQLRPRSLRAGASPGAVDEFAVPHSGMQGGDHVPEAVGPGAQVVSDLVHVPGDAPAQEQPSAGMQSPAAISQRRLFPRPLSRRRPLSLDSVSHPSAGESRSGAPGSHSESDNGLRSPLSLGGAESPKRRMDSRRSNEGQGTPLSGGVHQMWRRVTQPMPWRDISLLKTGEGMLDWGAPVTSLDQLYAQAGRLDVILRRKAQDWAVASKGMFPLQSGSGGLLAPKFVLWEEAVHDARAAGDIKWGQIKSPDRAVEKLLRSYRQDASRLLDICRQHIVFETLADMLDCVSAIEADGEVVVVRVKNKMRLDYNSTQSAGYRDLALNVRVVSEETRVLGLAGHVCEVQLQLREFARLKNRDGHRRYVRYRNHRAE